MPLENSAALHWASQDKCGHRVPLICSGALCSAHLQKDRCGAAVGKVGTRRQLGSHLTLALPTAYRVLSFKNNVYMWCVCICLCMCVCARAHV